jgi:hypothetical protein
MMISGDVRLCFDAECTISLAGGASFKNGGSIIIKSPSDGPLSHAGVIVYPDTRDLLAEGPGSGEIY